jgi:hypothetical protein
MNCTDCKDRIHDFVDGELAPAAARAVEEHVALCGDCRAQLDSLRALLEQSATLKRGLTPQRNLWSGISEQIRHVHVTHESATEVAAPRRQVSVAPVFVSRRSVLSWIAPLATAAAVIVLAAVAERNVASHAGRPAWVVAAVAGAPRIGARTFHDEAKFRVGQWLETDAISRARVAVGSIGEVNLEPNSRLRLVGAAATNHRLELARGTLNALISAPPRLFFVDTPSATAVDLGCAYTLTVGEDGNGELRVITGYVALEEGDRESILRTGMMCYTRRGVGPGTPFESDAPEALRAALVRFDFEPGASTAALNEVIAHARRDDAVTLWHLLARTKGPGLAAVFDALAGHAPPPATVTREGILRGSAAMRDAWAAELGLERL